jgi:hypothetical protein
MMTIEFVFCWTQFAADTAESERGGLEWDCANGQGQQARRVLSRGRPGNLERGPRGAAEGDSVRAGMAFCHA